jgi:2-oxo-3-hexenedioate decarboxylase
MSQYQDIANYLVSAEEDRREVPKVTVNMKPDLSVEERILFNKKS